VRFERAGLPCEVVAGAGTGAPAADLAARVFSELQPGSYIFLDKQYAEVHISHDDPRPFRTSVRQIPSKMSTSNGSCSFGRLGAGRQLPFDQALRLAGPFSSVSAPGQPAASSIEAQPWSLRGSRNNVTDSGNGPASVASTQSRATAGCQVTAPTLSTQSHPALQVFSNQGCTGP